MEKKIKQLLKLIKLNENTLSMFFGIVTVALVAVLAFRMYSTNKPTITREADNTSATSTSVVMLGEVKVETNDKGEAYALELPSTYKVEAGDHLWKIATKLYGSGYNWVDIAKENKLSNPGQIEVGQELSLPKVAIKMTIDQKVAMSEDSTDSKTLTIEGAEYTVAKGDTLWSISLRAYADGYRFPEIAKANNIVNVNKIEVGQKLVLPR